MSGCPKIKLLEDLPEVLEVTEELLEDISNLLDECGKPSGHPTMTPQYFCDTPKVLEVPEVLEDLQEVLEELLKDISNLLEQHCTTPANVVV